MSNQQCFECSSNRISGDKCYDCGAEFKRLKLKITQDIDPVNPRVENDNLGNLFICENRYFCGDKNAGDPTFLDDDDQFICLPVFHMTHGYSILNTTGFGCPWDSGQCGWIYMSLMTFTREYGPTITEENKKNAENYLKCEVKEYSDFLSGNIYGFEITDSDGNFIDSCWGFAGCDPETNGMIEHFEYPAGNYEIEGDA